ncbi:hypothetical protein BDP27DRAFT_1336216 [Rhodocollybia butyracea]|uniref:Uncharacterized protein n=1 Tax=Rhodocollybia butyracea TaxID=206335 RepID=A0A9P5PHE8_9AGAR|nr:hypothetical protein BDP27DRAFT_1336216 [Rhodocollybia butyracea]
MATIPNAANPIPGSSGYSLDRPRSQMMTAARGLPSFIPLNIPMPMGIWRFPLVLRRAQPTTPFAYSLCSNKDAHSTFASEFQKEYSIQHRTILRNSGFMMTAPDVQLPSAAWKHKQSGSIFFARCSAYDYIDKDGRSYYCVGWLNLPNIISNASSVRLEAEGFSSSSDFRFHCSVREGVIDVYCSDSISECHDWIESYKGNLFDLIFPGPSRPFSATLQSPYCNTCAGIHLHKTCPFLTLSKGDKPHLENPFRTPTHPVLERHDLVEAIIDRVATDHFLLIEAPRCSGKSTLLEDIAVAVMDRPTEYAIHYMGNRVDPATHEMLMQYPTALREYSSGLTCDITSALDAIKNKYDLMKLLESEWSMEFEFWIFIDEAQLLYDNTSFWFNVVQAACSAFNPNFYVIAAGTYASHTGSWSKTSEWHTAPAHLVMDLFPSSARSGLRTYFAKNNNDPSCIAFNESDFHQFVDLALAKENHSLDGTIRKQIIAYASSESPACHSWARFIHPGVVTELTKFTIQKLSHSPPPGWKTIIEAFTHKCISDASSTSPSPLGQCIPHEPAHGEGIPAPMLTVFLSILLEKTIRVTPIDTMYMPRMVINTALYIRDRQSRSPHLMPSKIPLEHLTTTASLSDKVSSSFRTLGKLMKRETIAVTSCERFHNVIAGNSVSVDARPYSVREYYGPHALSDYEQAAHDARRMGWLVQDPDQGLQLRLPTQWHREYLKALLKPAADVRMMLFDDFLVKVISEFRSSVLNEMLATENKLREVNYDSEFKHAADTVGGTLFLIPQSRTEVGDGIVSFACLTREWAIELMCEGKEVKQHISQFKPGGAFHQACPAWDWRVVDFYLGEWPIDSMVDSRYRAVCLTHDVNSQCIRATIKGDCMAEMSVTLKA